MTLNKITDEQRGVIAGRLHALLDEIVPLADSNKEILSIFQTLYKLKFTLEHEMQINKISPKQIDRKEVKKEIDSLLQ